MQRFTYQRHTKDLLKTLNLKWISANAQFHRHYWKYKISKNIVKKRNFWKYSVLNDFLDKFCIKDIFKRISLKRSISKEFLKIFYSLRLSGNFQHQRDFQKNFNFKGACENVHLQRTSKKFNFKGILKMISFIALSYKPWKMLITKHLWNSRLNFIFYLRKLLWLNAFFLPARLFSLSWISSFLILAFAHPKNMSALNLLKIANHLEWYSSTLMWSFMHNGTWKKPRKIFYLCYLLRKRKR